MQRIYLIDDEEGMIKPTAFFLKTNLFDVSFSTDPEKGLRDVQADPPNLILLDLRMPVMDGFAVLREIRGHQRTASVPVIMLSLHGEETNIVTALELGADDYIMKPFRNQELLARMRSAMRKRSAPSPATELRSGALRLDLSLYQASLDGSVLALSPKEFQLLAFFIREEGRVLIKSTISEKVWTTPHLTTSRTIDTTVKQLRKKLGLAGEWIKTLRGIGYRFEPDS